MIRNLHPIDSPAFLPFKLAAGRARAYPLPLVITGQARSFPLVKYAGVAMSPSAWQSCWVQTQRARIQVLMRAGQRSGKLAWEVSDLYVHEKFGSAASEALEQLAVPAGKSGARRVFLRMSSARPAYGRGKESRICPRRLRNALQCRVGGRRIRETGRLQRRPWAFDPASR